MGGSWIPFWTDGEPPPERQTPGQRGCNCGKNQASEVAKTSATIVDKEFEEELRNRYNEID